MLEFFKGEDGAGLDSGVLECTQLRSVRGILENWTTIPRDLRIMFREGSQEWILKLLKAKGAVDKTFLEEAVRRLYFSDFYRRS